jgi:iron complex transport system ATP-binding protein
MGRRPLPPDRRSDDEAAVARAMLATESAHLANRQCNTLSEGELARVSIARVLVQEAPLLLLDEPVANLDVRHQHMIMYRLGSLAKSGTAVLSIVHDINLAYRYADRIAVIHNGRLIACDVPERIADEALLQSVFDFPVRIVRDGASSVPIVVPLADATGMQTLFGE